MRTREREWYEAGKKEGAASVLNELPDEIDIYRAIKASGARKHADIAAAIARLYTKEG